MVEARKPGVPYIRACMVEAAPLFYIYLPLAGNRPLMGSIPWEDKPGKVPPQRGSAPAP